MFSEKTEMVEYPKLFYMPHNRKEVQLLSCVWLWDSMDCSRPGLPVHHQLPEFTQIHVHWVSDPIQPSHTFYAEQRQFLKKWGNIK